MSVVLKSFGALSYVIHAQLDRAGSQAKARAAFERIEQERAEHQAEQRSEVLLNYEYESSKGYFGVFKPKPINRVAARVVATATWE